MKLNLNMRSILPILFIGTLLITQCTGEGGKTNQQQSKSEAILTARTMGLAFLEENKLEEAEAEFKKLVSLAPEEAIGYANLGLVYLRMGSYEEAEMNLKKALDIIPEDADIRLNLAMVYKYMNQHDRFIKELETSIAAKPDHIQSLYMLAESYSSTSNEEELSKRESYLNRTVEACPTNIVPRLYLVESLLRTGKSDPALSHLEEVRQIFPEFPEEAREYYDQTYKAIVASKKEEALTSLLIFHNFLKLTNPYNNGITELKGFEGSSMGVPLFTFSEAAPVMMAEGESILDAIRFTDVTDAAGLNLMEGTGSGQITEEQAAATHITMGDLDHDGTEDLYVGSYIPGERNYRHFLLRSEMGRFKDITEASGIKHKGEESFAVIADYNNDGWFDLMIMNEGSPLLYESVSEGMYDEVSRKAFGDQLDQGSRGIFFDMDHEGDLDLFISRSGKNVLFRNNGDGSFTDYAEASGLAGDVGGTIEACFGDFDDDGDIDLFVVNRDGTCALYTNLREGRFRDITAESGLREISNATMATAGDYNNDGYLDLFVAGRDGSSYQWLVNSGQGTFEPDNRSTALPGLQRFTKTHDAQFLDFDNDGFLDLLTVGEPEGELLPGGLLMHNKGNGAFEDVSHLLPEDLEGGRQIHVVDYNEDGDMDIFLAGLHGGVRLLRNDGGNANHHLKMRLKGIRAGSGKNNHYGIGAKIELRAGNLYQMKVVTQPNIYFGLADRSEVDVVRILWTNGTPQNIFTPGIEQDLIEEQQLKGSCPFLYTWNGEEFEFVKDIMWRSALGMPMGIMGEEQTYAFANASEDYLKIPGEMLRAKNGKFTLQITEELWETIYLDKVELVVVDHPEATEIYVDEQFVPPPYPPLKIYHVTHKLLPLSASDGAGNDVLELITQKDNRYVSGFQKRRYQGITEMSRLTLDPGSVPGTDHMFLFLNGWIFPTDASINLALSQGENERVVAPYLQVMNQAGEWETVIDNIGFPQGKNKTIIIDLRGKFLSGDRGVRICTNMEIYWDYAFFASPSEDASASIVRLTPASADHHFRGFSELYRKGGRYGPHWFDYSSVTTEQKWRDLSGRYTRYGDVHELLLHSDNQYIIANAGDETTIQFDAGEVNELTEGWRRDFLIYSVGWVKDGDMNTAEGNRVEPLPFHGMSRYPYDESEAYPDNKEARRYQKKYNTREVTDREFSRAVIEKQ